MKKSSNRRDKLKQYTSMLGTGALLVAGLYLRDNEAYVKQLIDYIPESWTYLIVKGFLVLTIGFLLWLVYSVLVKPRLQERRERIFQAERNLNYVDENTDNQVLFLRPFKADNRHIASVEFLGQRYYTFESLLCAMLNEQHIPIAIGKPTEKLPPMGATRIYSGERDWMVLVSDFLDRSEYVLLYVDFTPGVKWEIHESLNRSLDKLIIIPRLYNAHGKWRTYLFICSIVLIPLVPIAIVFDMFLWPRKVRRGYSYYRQWKSTITDKSPSISGIDDRVSAITFENGDMKVYKTKAATVESQLQAILDAVREKTKQKNDKEEGI